MSKISKGLVAIIFLFIITNLLGCNNPIDETPKIDEYIEVLSYKEIKENQYDIEYRLKKDIEEGSGLLTQNLTFNNGTKNYKLISKEKGTQKITVEGNNIKLIYNGSNRYKEEKSIK